ncbi:MAG: TonB-dependent receptor [Acidobacteria bacterium]|nr:TonB-dependent receptor [Acidobacteriota bacterium]
MRHRLGAKATATILVFLSQPVLAQTPAQRRSPSTPTAVGRLLVTVADPSGAVIPGATVTILGQDDATKAATVAPAQTSDKGIATFERLALGRYNIQAEFPGFENGTLKDIRIRSGDNKHILVLPLQKLTDTVTVGRDAQEAAADPRGRSFGTALTREQIEALSDDPEEMQRQLQEMAGPGAVMRIDSFEGGKLPPKAQIKAVHITRDAFAAENHFAGALFIDIITQPGVGPLRGGVNFRLRDGSMSGRSPFTPTKGPEQTRDFGTNIGGSLISQKSSFNIGISGTSAYETPNLNVALPGGATRSEALSIRSPRDSLFVRGLLDYAVTKDQTLRLSFFQNRSTQKNLGIGAYDLPERAYSSDNRSSTLRIQEAGPLGRRFFTNTRLQITWSDSDSHAVVEAPTIHVNDAFTSGGQQMAGGRHTRSVNLASDLDYVRGIHSLRTGIVLDSGWHRSDDTSNYLGTYTFESLAAFEEGRPRGYRRRLGDPTITYWNLEAGWYLQDDIRVRKNLTLSPGVRWEAQTHLQDLANIGPRFGITWAPGTSGNTTLRASWGIFYDWLNPNTYEQTLRVDGFRQRELNIVDPIYPDPGFFGVIPPINRYLLGDDVQMGRTMRLSAGLDRKLTPKIRVSTTYSHMRGADLLRGANLNAPVAGVRPDPVFGNVVEVLSDAASRQHQLSTNVSYNLSAPSPDLNKARFNWRRLSFNLGHFLGRSENNTDGAFNMPPSGDLATEWGPAAGDVRQRVFFFISTSMLKNFNVFLNVNASSAPPYAIRTGRDDNGDLVFNDRPLGVGRNTARSRGQFTLSGSFAYTFSFGKRTIPLPPGIRIMGTGAGGFNIETVAQPDAPRYRLTISLNVQNLTNHANYSGFSGTMTSPFFGRPTTVLGTRKIDIGMNFSF